MTHPQIVHDAKELAGCFYERNRSEKFRASWPNIMTYVNTKWPHFVQGVREGYAELLGRDDVPEEDKERMFAALTDNAESVYSDAAGSPLQIAKDSQQFHGDKYENRMIREKVGSGAASLASRLRTTTAKILLPG